MLAIVLIGAAVVAFMRARSAFIPHQMPRKLITEGVFRLSRNPICLAELLLLVGLSLRAGFGAAADACFARTRRWLSADAAPCCKGHDRAVYCLLVKHSCAR